MNLKIVLFDDTQAHRDAVLAALRAALGTGGTVEPFMPDASGVGQGTFEARLVSDLQAEPHRGTDLIVADRDLSGYSTNYRGLSESTVRRAADELGLPECGYARGERDDDAEYVKRGELRESCIRLSRKPDDATFARRVVAVAAGFRAIGSKVADITDAAVRKSPGRMLAAILGKPQYAEKILLYASGDHNRLGSTAAVRASHGDERNRRLSCVLGYWLWDSVLRFPGVTVNAVAASSYLNIKSEVFRNDKPLRDLFSSALYDGPFAEARLGPLWWRGMLDDLVAEAKERDGRSYAEKNLGRPIPPSRCCEDQAKPAGYYCFLSEQPVSLENSRAGLPWFPRGADLARISKSRYEEDAPWL